ncbi:AHH domain-containing protein [Aeoliella sp. ICT_H6.2]|uniref:AHH domain-containing protein n=1 Tax=Aeoliella straminimaris TaxID=2954799 RepID=A0A9X2F8Z6_9BACT|nr:AHH domain-containing protein [Aeoliella straminimaris]
MHNSYGQQVDDAIEAGTLGLRKIRRLRGELHHIATDKDALFAPQLEVLFEKAGLSLQHPLNITRLPGHVGPHGKVVNQIILDRLVTATEGLSGTSFRNQLLDELWDLRRQIHNTDFGDLFKAAASRADVLGKF